MNTYEIAVLHNGATVTKQYQAVSEDAAREWAKSVLGNATFIVRLVVAAPGPRVTLEGKPDDNYTVEEASRFLTCHQPVPVKLLAKLGRDCSMVCRIRGAAWTERPTPSKQWLKERAYPFDIIREVFELNPDTAPYIPK
ncbi:MULTISPECIES: hypothetical protein, partial [Gammaproteobacteria]|uniref:hypothetical protein n=1 Tax=Gammaproteobacteria TaxID=1236 RepID=UPI00379BB377